MNTLIILAIGPTATILASDLADLGYQVLDIGHLDLEYEWFLANAAKKQNIPGKYTNESSNNFIDYSYFHEVEKKYKDSILDIVI